MPGKHWVWDSFKAKVNKIVAIMILNTHILPLESVRFRSNDEVLLNNIMVFDPVDVMNTDNDVDGCYILVDKLRDCVIHSLSTDNGMARDYWKHKN